MPTIPTDLRARVEAALTAAGQMTPGPLVLRRFVDGTGNDAAAVVHEASGETVATCDNEDRSDEARPVCDAAGIVALRNAAPDLRALLALLDAPAGLTVGAALADPRAQDGSHVVEYVYGRTAKWWQLGRDGVRQLGGAGWVRLGVAAVWIDTYALPCRLVPLADADQDPATRGAL